MIKIFTFLILASGTGILTNQIGTEMGIKEQRPPLEYFTGLTFVTVGISGSLVAAASGKIAGV